MNWKKEIYEWIFILTATAVMIIGAVHNYNGKILSAAGVFANGAFLFAFMSWCELRKARCKDSAENKNGRVGIGGKCNLFDNFYCRHNLF